MATRQIASLIALRESSRYACSAVLRCRANRGARRLRSSSPASGGKAVEYKAPRTPWGDPDLQGVWSSDDLENVPMSRPAQFKELYLDDAQFAAAAGAGRSRGEAARHQRREQLPLRLRTPRDASDVVDCRSAGWSAACDQARGAGAHHAAWHVRSGPAQLLGGLLALRALHHARHRGIDPSSHLRERQPDRPGAGRRGALLRDAARTRASSTPTDVRTSAPPSASTSVTRARIGRARSSSSRRRISPTRRRSASMATVCATAKRW